MATTLRSAFPTMGGGDPATYGTGMPPMTPQAASECVALSKRNIKLGWATFILSTIVAVMLVAMHYLAMKTGETLSLPDAPLAHDASGVLTASSETTTPADKKKKRIDNLGTFLTFAATTLSIAVAGLGGYTAFVSNKQLAKQCLPLVSA